MSNDNSSAQEVNIDKQRLGAVYADAIIAAAESQGQSDAIVDELGAIVDEIVERSPELDATLSSPRIPSSEKEDILNRVLGDRVSELLLTSLKVISRHGRLDCLRQIRRAAREKLNSMRNRVAVKVTTAAPLNDEQRHSIQDQLQRKMSCDVDLDCHVSPEILGGMVIRVGDTVYDTSVANRLAQVREQTIPKTFTQLRESIDRFAVSG